MAILGRKQTDRKGRTEKETDREIETDRKKETGRRKRRERNEGFQGIVKFYKPIAIDRRWRGSQYWGNSLGNIKREDASLTC